MIVVNLHKEEYDVHIGRPSKWGNPFKLDTYTRTESIKKYKEWILTQPELLASLNELDGKRLGCSCKPLPCHGDVLVELRTQQIADELL